jgi:serine/threonine-protein kinase RsbW
MFIRSCAERPEHSAPTVTPVKGRLRSERRVEMMLESNLESVDRAEEEALRFAEEAGFGEEDLQKVGMAVRETMINAVLHGNHYDPQKKAGLNLELLRGRLVITVTDQGEGFELNDVPDPLAQENLLRQSGRGIFLIRAFMDEVHLRRLQPKGMEVRMIKYPAAETSKEE